MLRQLPTHEGFTIDERLREFRRVTWDAKGNPAMDFVPFDSDEGERLLATLNLPKRPPESVG